MFCCCFFLCCNYNTLGFLSAIGLTIRGLAEFVVEARPTLLETSDCWVVTAGESSVHRHLSTCPNDSHDEQSIRLIRWKIRLCRV
jgi:hypothetical protein